MGWSAIAGYLAYETDEPLMDLARHRFHVAGGRGSGPYEPLPPERTDLRCGFVASRQPWRLAVLNLGPHDDLWPEVVGWGGHGWVSLEGDPTAITGECGDPGQWQRTHGDLGLRAMLNVEWLRVLTGGTLGPRLDVEPSRMLELAEMEDWSYAMALIAIGVDRQTFTYDPEVDALTSMSVYVDGEVAWSIRLAPLCCL